jgi:predicted RNA-binding Zn-ribbon protein involved in translation (DUF1610 family)
MTCTSCGKALSAPESAAGKRAKCPACGEIMIVPAPVLDAEPIDIAAPQPSSPWEPQPSPAADANWQGGMPDFGPSAEAGESDPGARTRRPCPQCGEMIIPCFSIYWQFVAFWGLSKELNRISREYGFVVPEANEQLALTTCILYCCGIVPYLGLLATLAGMVLSFIAVKNMCDVAVAIIRQSNVPTV